MNRFFIFLSALLLTPSLFAKIEGRLVIEDGKPVEYILNDGRVARAEFVMLNFNETKSSARIYQSSCGPAQNVNCDYELSLVFFQLAFKWAVHPDPARVNKDVMIATSGGSASLNEFIIINHYDLTPAQAQLLGTRQNKLTCPHYRFLRANLNTTPPAQVLSPLAVLESNIENSETGEMENRPESSFVDNVLSRCENSLCVTTLGEKVSHGGFSFSAGSFLGAETSVIIEPEANSPRTCQVGIRSNLDAVLRGLFTNANSAPQFSQLLPHPFLLDLKASSFSRFQGGTLREGLKALLTDNEKTME